MRLLTIIITAISLISPVQAAAQQVDESIVFEARIDQIERTTCDDEPCLILTLTGLDRDHSAAFSTTITKRDSLDGELPSYAQGDRVIVQQGFDGEEPIYVISDYARRTPLFWLAILFVVCILALGGKGAIRSFAGLVISGVLIFAILIPAILRGLPPVPVTIATSIILMFGTFLITHGRSAKTWAALGGTSLSLLLTGVLAWVFSRTMHLFGRGDEEMLFLLQDFPNLNTHGVLLAGIIIGTLGVLDDVTISQASAVMELKHANPTLSNRSIYGRALRIGRDHIAAAVNTLVLAYAGASLPLLLLLAAGPAGEPWWIVISREMIATEILRTLVGSIGLLAAVPLTTFLAARYGSPGHDQHHGHRH